MEVVLSKQEKDNKRKGMVVSFILHTLLLLILLLPFLGYPIPPPGQAGILISLGEPDVGEGDDLPDTQQEKVVEPSSPPAEKPQEKIEKPQTASRAAVKKVSQPNVLTSEEKEAIQIQKQKDAEQRKLADIARQERIAAEAEAERLAEAERQKIAEDAAQKAAFAESKKQYSALLGGSGKGNTGTAGNQGDPNGDPNAKALDGLSTGSGMVGGGLGGRGVLSEPKIKDNSQKTGIVVVNVCVDQLGEVVSASYTQRGSTTTDSELKTLAEKSALKFKFTPSEIEKQCGTVTIDFKVQ